MTAAPLLEVERLTVPPGADRRHAILDVSFALARGEILCLVGESGSGKSITAGAIMRLLPGCVASSASMARLESHSERETRRTSPSAICQYQPE